MNVEPHSPHSRRIQQALEHFEGPLLRYARRITGDLEQARDVVQETFIRLCREPPEAIDGHLAQWLFTVCRRRAIDVRKKEQRMHALTESQAEVCLSREPLQDAASEQRDLAGMIFRLLDTLPDKQQEVVRLKFQNGLSYREISAVTGLTVSNVGYLLHTALGTLREQLNDNATTP